ncbi:MAG: FMN-dependent NADH-azoreductase [Parvularculaceae bacterium]
MTTNLLRVDASMRRRGSRSRALADALIDRLRETRGPLAVTRRDLADGVPFVDEAWIAANFAAPAARTGEQRAVLARSDALLDEVRRADVLVLATPIYNFGPPAALKAWIDMVVRAREAFRYGPDGPAGLLTGKSAYVVVTSGGTRADSEIDFATPYLRHILGFVGVDDVTVVASDLSGVDAATADAAARRDIARAA